jgi:diguanylate cyclase (GGDEF)-like protein
MACVRVCPVEAIAISGDDVRIVEDSCIECGLCVPSCHHDAIDVFGDLEATRRYLDGDRAVLILPTEAAVYFFPATPEQLINACIRAGFARVHFETVGDELVAEEYLRLWRNKGSHAWIRSTSPIVVDYCRLKLPELLPFLAPIVTPAVALARYLEQTEPPGTRIVYAGVGTPGSNGTATEVDTCISFSELDRLLLEAGAPPVDQPLVLTRLPTERRRYLSLAGGMPRELLQDERLSSRRFHRHRGLDSLDSLARAVIGEETGFGFHDVLPFEGTLGHPAYGPDEDLYWRKEIADLAEPQRSEVPVITGEVDVPLQTSFEANTEALPRADPADVERILDLIGKAPGGRYWNTGSCGHATCVEFAHAVARGRSTLSLCPIYLNRQYEQAAKDALRDGLTDLFTFRVLEQRLAEEVARSNRSGTSLALLFLDVDSFKPVNDDYGHEAGNQMLKGIARIISNAIRTTDIACRYGGDEFVVILVDPDTTGAWRVAEQIREGVESLVLPTEQGDAGVTLSIGLAYHSGASGTSITGGAMMAEADASLYVAKAHGGNTVHPAPGGEFAR